MADFPVQLHSTSGEPGWVGSASSGYFTLIKNLFDPDWGDSTITAAHLRNPDLFLGVSALASLVNVPLLQNAGRWLEVRAAFSSLTPTDDFTTNPSIRVYGFFPSSQILTGKGVSPSTGLWAPLYRRDTGAFVHTLSFSTIACQTTTHTYTSDILLDVAGASKVLAVLDPDATQPSIDSGESASLVLSIEGRLLDA